MKKKFSKILGVGLSLVLLTGLMVMTAPASASTLSWGAEKDPEHTNWEHLVLENSTTSLIDVAAVGDIIYVATDNTSTPLFKSSDGGATWANLGSSSSFPTSVSVTSVAIAQDDPDYVAIATSANEIEYSSNGGGSWTDLNGPADDATVNDIDISNGSTKYIVAGGTDGTDAELYVIKLSVAQSWDAEYGNTGANTTVASAIHAVKFSPNWATDAIILAVSGNSTATTLQVYRDTTGAQTWNSAIAFFASDWGTGLGVATVGTGVGSADISLPPTYLGNDLGLRRAFVSVAGTSATNTAGVFRFIDSVKKGPFDVWGGGNSQDIGSIAYHDDLDVLLGGDYDTNQVYRWLTPNSGDTPDADRLNLEKRPSGDELTKVVWAGDNAVAATSGDESALSVYR